MGKSCCIEGCNSSSPEVEHYKFPRSGALRLAWIEATGCYTGAVCAAHFTADDYKCERGGRRLRGAAVPSVLCKPPSSKENGEIASADTTTTKEAVTGKNVKAKAKNKKAKEKKNINKSKTEITENRIENNTDSNKDATDSNKDTTDSNNDTTDKILESTGEKVDREKKISDPTEKESIDDRESSKEVVDTRQEGEKNGKNEKNLENAQAEVNDIEDMITNYQIKQTKTLADRLNPEPLEDLIPALLSQEAEKAIEVPVTNEIVEATIPDCPMPEIGPNKLVDVGQLANHLANKLDNQLAQIMASAPVFIEVAVDQDDTRAESPQDCLMLLESVQCDIDPSSLMLPEHGPETDSDMEILETDIKKEDPNPISLLTSSDEDEVIIEEPHIDTVEVSDETDEDDRPLQTLIRAAKPKPAKPEKTSKKKSRNFDWGCDFYCAQCDYKTNCEAEFKQHNLELMHLSSTTIHVCPTCNYSTASKAQFSRHKRKHRDERNFKCHLCNYKARHNMSLIYHLKCHAPVEKKSEKFTCDKCGFSSNVKSEALSHLKSCAPGSKYGCDQCSYTTKRRSDLRRHKMRRHSVDDSDEDFTI